MQREIRLAEFLELSGLFFLHGMALGSWFVPLGTVLDAHGLQAVKPYAFATSAIAAFVSPLVFGAMADRHVAPVRVLRWLAFATAAMMSLVATAIHRGASPWLVLGLIQVLALCTSPAWSLSNSIVLGRLSNAQRQFGPVRALATIGWMAGCWLISALRADTSVMAIYSSAAIWFSVGMFSLLLPSPAPPASTEHLTIRQRLGLDALSLLKQHDHRVVFLTAALFAIPLAAFYPYAPTHLRQLGMERTSAWMTLGQVTEVAAMFVLSGLLGRWRLKHILAAGLTFGFIRYSLCALNGKGWVLAGISLHGCAFTLFFITAQIYLDQRIDPRWRARAQALFSLMSGGVGNLAGYLGTGWWLQACRNDGGVNWSLFWGGLAGAAGAVLIYFVLAYHGRGAQPAITSTEAQSTQA